MEFNEACKYDRLSTNENEDLTQSKDSQKTKASINFWRYGILLILITFLSLVLNIVLLFYRNAIIVTSTPQCASTYGQILRFVLERLWLILL